MKKLALLFLTLCLLATCLGCSSQSAADNAASEPSAPESAPSYDGEYAMKEEMGMTGDMSMPEESLEDSASNTLESQTSTQTDFSEKIIYSAYIFMETTTFDQATESVSQLVLDCGGFLENTSTYGNPSYNQDGTTRVVDRSAHMVIRVPSQNYEKALSQAGTIGNIISCDQNAENVTSQFLDMEAHVEALNVQQTRLLELLAKADDVDTLVTLEARLSEVSYEINTIQRQLDNMQLDVDYSTITLDIQEVALYTPTATTQRSFGEKIGSAFSDGIRNFGNWLECLALTIVTNLIGIVIFIAIVVGAVVVIKKIRKRNKQARTKEDSENPNEK